MWTNGKGSDLLVRRMQLGWWNPPVCSMPHYPKCMEDQYTSKAKSCPLVNPLENNHIPLPYRVSSIAPLLHIQKCNENKDILMIFTSFTLSSSLLHSLFVPNLILKGKTCDLISLERIGLVK